MSGSLQTSLIADTSVQLPSKEEVALFRNSLKQNICVQMLKEGYHRSFSELFFLIHSNQDETASTKPGSVVSLLTPLEEQQDKLEAMRLHLTRAEQAERIGSWSVVCEQRLCLGDLEEARHQAELCLTQADSGDWLDSAGCPLRLRVRRALCRIYSQLADAPLATANYDEALALLHKGYSIATESEDKEIQGDGAYRLGLAYQCSGDHDTAKKFFNTCMQICGTLQDADGLGEAYKAMATSLESEGNTDASVRCLEEFADISRSSGLLHNLVDACLCLGNVFYTMSQYKRACESFLQGYEVACQTGDVAPIQTAQVLVANARARSLIKTYSADVASATPTALHRLLAWKDTRGHEELSADCAAPTTTAWY